MVARRRGKGDELLEPAVRSGPDQRDQPLAQTRLNGRRPRRTWWRPLAGIRAQLTASYAVVVIAAAAALSIAATGFALARGTNDVRETPPVGLLEKNAANAARFFAAGPPAASITRFSVLAPALSDLSRISASPVAVGVVDSSGRLLVADSCTYRAGETSGVAQCVAEARRLFASVLHTRATRKLLGGAATGTNPVEIAGTRRSLVAVPILEPANRHALVAVFAGSLPAPEQSSWSRFWAEWESTIPKDGLSLIVVTIVVGTLVGLLLSHRFVRRLQQLSATADAWGHGDLSAVAVERNSDELGRLALRLNQMADQIRNLLDTRAAVAAEEERRRVQRDLHDGVKQELFAASMELAAAKTSIDLNPEAAGEALSHAQAACRRAQHELALLLHDEPAPHERNLNAALSELCGRMAADAGVGVSYDGDDAIRVPVPAAEALFRVTQEALSNVRRHAAASRVSVRLRALDGNARLDIADDGRGFDVAHVSTGMGLASMRARVAELAGELKVKSGTSGTSVHVVLPLK